MTNPFSNNFFLEVLEDTIAQRLTYCFREEKKTQYHNCIVEMQVLQTD